MRHQLFGAMVVLGALAACGGGQAAACDDGVKNGGESGKDCGGSCPKCPPGESCATGGDCASGVCSGTPLACQAPACTDGVANGGKADVDCAGPCPKKCGAGKACAANGDCATGVCSDYVCSQINGCDFATSTDLTAQANVTVSFLESLYLPPCIKVKVGTMVTFSGSFGSHPLKAGEIVNNAPVDAPAGTSPLPTSPGGLGTGTTATFAMTPAGTYPYYCTAHYGEGMVGTIFVVP